MSIRSIETLQQDMDSTVTLLVCVPLAACPPVRPQCTGSLATRAHKNPDLGVFSL